MFQKIQQLIDDKEALVFVLIDEVNKCAPLSFTYLSCDLVVQMEFGSLAVLIGWCLVSPGGKFDGSKDCLPSRN